jgi:hypothetical protein
MIINALRGMHVCVPRNMVQAVGMYNTLLRGNDPGLIVECLNGYRLKESLPTNLLEFTIPLGVPEIVKEGTDVTVVSYGSTLRIVMEAVEHLSQLGISCEGGETDTKPFLPFDIHHHIATSLKKDQSNCFLWMRMCLEVLQHICLIKSWKSKELAINTRMLRHVRLLLRLTGQPYGSDGDYFAKPNKRRNYYSNQCNDAGIDQGLQ